MRWNSKRCASDAAWIGCIIVLAAMCSSSCESTAQVASACEDGKCAGSSTAIRSEPPTCTLGTLEYRLNVMHGDPVTPGNYFESICLPHMLPRSDDGRVACDLRVQFESDEITSKICSEVFDVPVEQEAGGPLFCALRQLPPLDGPGFYYDDSSERALEICAGDPWRVAFTPSDLLRLPETSRIDLHCEFAVADLADADVLGNPDGTVYLSIDSCYIPPQTEEAADAVGRACEPQQVYAEGFNSAEVYLDSTADECDTGSCLVYQLDGRVDESCDPAEDECAPEDQVERRVGCTCRCSAEDPGDAELCACPNGFACEPLLRGTGPAAGGYCVDQALLTGRSQ